VILKTLLASLFSDGISRPRIAEELTIPTEELEQLLFGLTMTGIKGGGHGRKSSAKLSRVK
jgi:hypothetical protein